jgi:putative MATE family efflux protein
MKAKGYEIDMVNGPLLGKILLFYVPLMLSSVLQLLFNAADIIVVGQYAGANALGAVGATSSLINLLVNLFMGLSVGVNVLVANYYGAKRDKDLSEMVHTAVATSFVSGVILVVVGLVAAGPALTLMETPQDFLNQSVLYMRIYFLGMPFSMAYNFGSAVLRAVGDTRRPLYYLFTAGVINVILNLIFVIFFHMSVAGVASATVISQAVSAFLVIRCLLKADGVYRLELSKLHIYSDKLIRMIRIGLPAGVQGTLFSISNVLIQSSVNSFGAIAVAGNTAASNIEGFVYVAMNSFYQASISFTGQNYGAGKRVRVLKVAVICEVAVIAVGLVLGNAAYLFGDKLLLLYSNRPEVIAYGVRRLAVICVYYCLCGMMDVMVGVLRGMGHSLLPMFVSLTGACLFRIIWIMTIFRQIRTLECLYWSYPFSWAVTFAFHLLCFIIIFFRTRWKENEVETVEPA